MMIAAWSIISYFTVKFFVLVLKTPGKSDGNQ